MGLEEIMSFCLDFLQGKMKITTITTLALDEFIDKDFIKMKSISLAKPGLHNLILWLTKTMPVARFIVSKLLVIRWVVAKDKEQVT